MKKSLVAILAAAVFLLSSLGPAFYMQTVQATDPSDWYTIVNGVLTSDYYSLYPYNALSIDFGLSKYGEMISYDPVTGTGVGLQYPGYDSVGTYDQTLGTSRDPFANEYIDPKLWLNGWLIDVRYTHRTLRDRRILAMAMFADMAAYGGDWIVGHPYPFNLAPHGGRKTTAYAETEDLQVLYNGPRRYVALSVTHLYDWEDSNLDGIVDHPDETWPVVDIKLTFIFNKVKKQVIILKDIKQVISGKELDSPIDIQFSNREEWDLGPEEAEYGSYAHFYHQQLETCYGPEWHMAYGIYRERVESGWALDQVNVTLPPNYGPPIVAGSVRVYVNGVFMEEGYDYDINYETGEITWHIPIDPYEDWVEVVYKLHKGELSNPKGEGFVPYTGVPHLYDMAQIISADYAYVGWKAFWPTLSDYTVDGWAQSLMPLIWVNDTDFVPVTDEPDIPFVIGEWDFMLGKEYPMQFRGVEVVGLTDVWDGWDEQMGIWGNYIDREVKYQLDEVFNPWDLVTAVHKPAARWVDFALITDVGQTYETDIENVPVIVPDDPYTNYINIGDNSWIPDPNEWDQYCSFAERIINLYTGQLLIRGIDYDIIQTVDGTANITFYETGYMKILYSTMGMYVTTEDNANNATVYDSPDYDMDTSVWGDDPEAPIEFYIVTPNPTQSWKTATLKIRAWDVDMPDERDAVYLNGYFVGTLQGDSGEWAISEFDFPGSILNSTGMQLVQIFVSCRTDEALPTWINVTDSTTWPNMTASWVTNVDWGSIVFQHGEYIPMPRYEWITVGRDAASVDSAGAAMVSAAFKDKQVEIGLAGADMYDPEIANQMPWVMHKFGTGDTFTDYQDSLGRSALKDDWCKTWPVASSDMIGVGGPLANVLAYYGNDFAEAFFGLDQYTNYTQWENSIAALTCWNKNSYASNNTVGYAVVSTYKDINGTILFLIWGHWGRDTYYATKWFKEEGIFQLQEAPECLTSIIIEIAYVSTNEGYKPIGFHIVELLGTISEHDTWYHGGDFKGGIHDP